jgi:hypothetical protein
MMRKLSHKLQLRTPIFLITIEDSPTYSVTEVKTDVPQLTQEALANARSSLAATASEEKDLACPIHPLHHGPRQQNIDASPTIDPHFVKVLDLHNTTC